MDPETLADDLDRLAAGCTVLSRLLLSAPDAGMLERLRSPAILAQWPLPGPTADEGLRLLAASGAAGETLASIRADHAALFVGPGSMRAVPYESAHRSVERLLFGEHTLQVRAQYAQLGVAAPRLNREPDDHIGLELEFVATVGTAWRDAIDSKDPPRAWAVLEVGGAFVRDHLLEWAPELMDMITDSADTSFYQGVGRLGAAVLHGLAAADWAVPRDDPNQ